MAIVCSSLSQRGRRISQLRSQEAEMKSTSQRSSSLGYQIPVLMPFGQLGFWMQTAKIAAK